MTRKRAHPFNLRRVDAGTYRVEIREPGQPAVAREAKAELWIDVEALLDMNARAAITSRGRRRSLARGAIVVRVVKGSETEGPLE